VIAGDLTLLDLHMRLFMCYHLANTWLKHVSF